MILHTVETDEGPGQGAPVILLHGLFGQARNLGTVQRNFPTARRVIAMDLRNHGISPHARPMTYAAMAEDVRETAVALGAWPAIAAGHSMGGKVAMHLALSRPHEVVAMVSMDIAPVRHTPHFQEIAHAMQALPGGLSRRDADAALSTAIPDAPLRAFLMQNFQPGEKPWRIGLDAIADGLTDIEDFAGTGRYDGPALFIAGTRSLYVGPAQHAAIRAMFPAARIETCETGHWLHADDPVCVRGHLQRFLDGVPG